MQLGTYGTISKLECLIGGGVFFKEAKLLQTSRKGGQPNGCSVGTYMCLGVYILGSAAWMPYTCPLCAMCSFGFVEVTLMQEWPLFFTPNRARAGSPERCLSCSSAVRLPSRRRRGFHHRSPARISPSLRVKGTATAWPELSVASIHVARCTWSAPALRTYPRHPTPP